MGTLLSRSVWATRQRSRHEGEGMGALLSRSV